MSKKVLVTGAGGFIAYHLINFLKSKNYTVIGVDRKYPKYSGINSDEFFKFDLRDISNCESIFKKHKFDEVYHLAAEMGGMGYIDSDEVNIMTSSSLMNINMVYTATKYKTPKYFFSSSVCVYPDMKKDEPTMTEEQVYPAFPDNEYGWEKLFAERLIQTYSRHFPIDIRIARFQNCYGTHGTWDGGREKAPAAISRKIAKTQTGEIEVWGDGTAIRNFIYVDDLVDGIDILMNSEVNTPVNIGTDEYVDINQLVDIVSDIAQKQINKKYIVGAVGVESRNFSNDKIKSLGWLPKYSLKDGMKITYQWVKEQVEKNN